MEFPLKFWLERILQNILPFMLFSQNTTSWILFSTMEQVKHQRIDPFPLLVAQYLT